MNGFRDGLGARARAKAKACLATVRLGLAKGWARG